MQQDRETSPSSSLLGRRAVLQGAAAAVASSAVPAIARRAAAQEATAQAEEVPAATESGGKPMNFLIIWGDDVGWWNPSCYNRGMMGYQTPNMDRIAAEGALFQAWYGENSCTAGRAAFITGQCPVRTGLTKVGLPGATLGLQPEDPTIANLLKPLGYATGQFGKNHLGDLNKYLPTVHGFDEFYGFLYHLNAFDEPESPNYPTDPAFAAKYGPRGVLHCFATDVDDPTDDPRYGPVGKQTIEDTGPLTIERQGTIDDEVVEKTAEFIRRAVDNDKPFFVWHNAARMHMHTHLKPESQGVTGLGVEADGMVEHDGHIGQLLGLLDDLGVADTTMVMYATDNGASFWSWPDAGTTPFRSEKDTVWEGGFRVPCMIRWPGVIEPGTISNDFYSMTDMLPTIVAAAGNPDVSAQLLEGLDLDGTTYKVHIDGYDLLPYWTGQVDASPRTEFFYWDDDGDLGAFRFGRWKDVFLDQRAHGRQVWIDPAIKLRVPYLFDLLMDPFEKAQLDSTNYNMWVSENSFIGYPVQGMVASFLETFKEYPPRQKPASFNVEEILAKLTESANP